MNPIVAQNHMSQAQIQDEFLIIEAAKQNPERFAPIYDRYYKMIFNFIYQRMEDKEAAFDLTSQVFLVALTKLPQFEFRGVPFMSWLFRIAMNELRMNYRKNQNQRTVNVNDDHLRDLITEVEESDFAQYQDKALELIKQLPEEELQMIELRFFEKRKFREIAEILNITESKAKVTVMRTLEKLKKKLLSK